VPREAIDHRVDLRLAAEKDIGFVAFERPQTRIREERPGRRRRHSLSASESRANTSGPMPVRPSMMTISGR